MLDTQENLVLQHLKEHGSITSMEAINLFGATRLSAIIYNLRHKNGCDILTNLETVTTRLGQKTSIARYILVKENK